MEVTVSALVFGRNELKLSLRLAAAPRSGTRMRVAVAACCLCSREENSRHGDAMWNCGVYFLPGSRAG